MSKKSLVTLSGQSLFPKVSYESLTYNNYVLSEIVNRLINKTNAIENYLFNRYFYIENLSSSTHYLITLQKNGSPNDIELEFSNDNQQTWHTLSTSGINSISFDIPANGKVYLKGNNLTFSTSSSSYYTFNFGELHCNIGGKLMSLVGDNDMTSFMFCHLFENNYNLISAENLILPDNVANNCYFCMFSDCTSLVNAPQLPATTLAVGCYESMFYVCTSLVNAPELPATTLAKWCYQYMFDSCTALIDAPALPATTLAIGCYSNMFCDCTSLVNAPELLATILVDSCYTCMFQGCTSLNYIKAMFTTTSPFDYTSNWVNGVASTGTFVKNYRNTMLDYGPSGIPENWESQIEYFNVFYIENISSEDCTFTIVRNGSLEQELSLDYSLNNKSTWNYFTTADITSISIPANSKVYFKGDNDNNRIDSYNNFTFCFDRECNVGGDIMSLFDDSESVVPYMFMKLFLDNSSLISTENLILPNNVSEYCYESMFSGCTSLVNAPVLPATTLAVGCYNSMFSDCTSLVNAPQLPATTLAVGCYESMFYGCTSLVNAPALPATTLAIGCYSNMFCDCTSLVNAPELLATTLVDSCYACMFNGCTNLNYIKAMFTTTPVFNFTTSQWLENVSSTGTFVKNADATWEIFGSDAIPEGWIIETAAS